VYDHVLIILAQMRSKTSSCSGETLNSPWLTIPLEDYEAHMALPAVGQAQMLAEQLAKLIERHAPASVAVMGCAGGNGLERFESTCVQRVVSVDINPEYIAVSRMRYANRLANLGLRCADVESPDLQFEPVELIYAALIFEYTNTVATLATLKRNLRPGGTLAVILQLAHPQQHAITPSVYGTLNALSGAFRLVVPADLRAHASAAGFEFVNSSGIDLPSEKQFLLQTFKLPSQ
jgi:ubiquinone/menaquinone biosynthesis C-methylase UbiE